MYHIVLIPLHKRQMLESGSLIRSRPMDYPTVLADAVVVVHGDGDLLPAKSLWWNFVIGVCVCVGGGGGGSILFGKCDVLGRWCLTRSEPRNYPTVLNDAAPLPVHYGAWRNNLHGGCSIGRW